MNMRNGNERVVFGRSIGTIISILAASFYYPRSNLAIVLCPRRA